MIGIVRDSVGMLNGHGVAPLRQFREKAGGPTNSPVSCAKRDLGGTFAYHTTAN